jgi:radical SAM protein with 4Fe4S-binding SPASM domain
MRLYIEKLADNDYMVFDPKYLGLWKLNKSMLYAYLSAVKSKTLNPNKIHKILKKRFVDKGLNLQDVAQAVKFIKEERMPLKAQFDPENVLINSQYYIKGVISPPEIALEITTACPYSCLWCYVDEDSWRDPRGYLPVNVIRENIIKPMIRYGSLVWDLTGGEPSFEPIRTIEIARMINELTKHCSGKQPHIQLITNGYRFRQLAAKYKLAGISFVQFSLPTLRERSSVYQSPPPKIDPVAEVIEGVKEAICQGIRAGLNCVIFPEFDGVPSNLDEVTELIETAIELEAEFVRITPVIPPFKSRSKIELPIDFMENLKNTVEETKKKLTTKHSKTAIINGIFPGYEYYEKVYSNSYISSAQNTMEDDLSRIIFCQAGSTFVHVDAYGKVSPCNHLIPEFVARSSVWEYPLDKIWIEDAIFKPFRKGEPVSEECNKCKSFVECTGSCRALVLRRFGSIDLEIKPENCPMKDARHVNVKRFA